MGVYKTGRSRTLTYVTTTAGTVLSSVLGPPYAVILPGPTPPGSQGSFTGSIDWASWSLATNWTSTVTGYTGSPTDNPTTTITFEWIGTSTLMGSADSFTITGNSTSFMGLLPAYGTLSSSAANTITSSIDVEEWVSISEAVVAGGSGSGDPPGPTTVVFYELPRVGGTASLNIVTAYGSHSRSVTITAGMLSGIGYIYGAGIDLQTRNGTTTTWSSSTTFQGSSLPFPSYSFTDSDGTGGHANGTQITVTSSTPSPGPTIMERTLSASAMPLKSYSSVGRINAMTVPYPDTISVDVNDHSNGTSGIITTVAVSGGNFTTSYDQHYYSVSSSFPHDSPRNLDERGALTMALNNASLTSLNEDTSDSRMPLLGWRWNAMSVSQADHVDVDASPAPSHWAEGANTSLSAGLTITIGSGSTGSVSSDLTAARTSPDALMGSSWQGVSFVGYRYLRLYLTVALLTGETSAPVRVSIGSKTWVTTVTSTGYIDIDLCCPTSATTSGSGVDLDDSNWTFTGPNGGPYGVSDGPLWGVSNVALLTLDQLAAGHAYTLTKVQLVRRDHTTLTLLPAFKAWRQAYANSSTSGTTTTTYYRRFFDGDTDGRRSLEQTDFALVHTDSSGASTDTFSPVTIHQVVQDLTAGASSFPSNGWSASDLLPAPSSGCPDSSGAYALRNCYLNSDRYATYLYGGGLQYTGSAWSVGIDLDVHTALTLPAQFFCDVIDWYPGAGDVWQWSGGAYGTMTCAAGKILRGDAWGLVFNNDGTPDVGVTVNLQRLSDGQTAGSATTSSIGEYETGSHFAKGQQTYRVLVATNTASEIWVARTRQRVGFVVVSAMSNPTNVHDRWGQYHRAVVQGGNIRYWRGDSGSPLPAWSLANVAVTSSGADSLPRLAMTSELWLFCVFIRGGSSADAYRAISYDDGATWSTPSMAIANATHVDNCAAPDGTYIEVGVVPSGSNYHLQAVSRQPGDTAFSSPYTLNDGSGNPLTVVNDSIGISMNSDHHWVLHVIIAGETSSSDWWSADHNASTWTRF